MLGLAKILFVFPLLCLVESDSPAEPNAKQTRVALGRGQKTASSTATRGKGRGKAVVHVPAGDSSAGEIVHIFNLCKISTFG